MLFSPFPGEMTKFVYCFWSMEVDILRINEAGTSHEDSVGGLGKVATMLASAPSKPYILGIYWVYPLLKGSLGVKQLGYHPKGTSIFPMMAGVFFLCC